MDNNKELFKTKYLQHILSGSHKDALQLSNNFLAQGNTIKDLYEEVMKPSLYEIGRLWEQNQITVAAEHLATAITEGILNSLYARIIPKEYNKKKVVLACAESEEHQVGVKMVADIFEMNEWESFFLGTGFPSPELVKYIDEVKPDLIALSLSVYFNFAKLKQMLNDLKASHPNIPILIGGQALQHVSEKAINEFSNVTYLSDLNSLEEYIANFK
ncbi:MAG TPA: cobalamin-dependent protein [Prolixibacteraceae bacterium]|nr:cobalamin-dependent protein [Prolixibacteraceae bacterium]